MKQKKTLGVFDSGIGGLSVLKHIQDLLPCESLTYIADSAYAPYGNKPTEQIIQRCKTLTKYLIEKHDIKALVIACNTASAAAVHELRESCSIPVIAMEPGVKPAISATQSGVVGVLATENTLTSQKFTDLVHRYAADVKVVSQACHGLVEQIEKGELNSTLTRQLLDKYISPLLDAGADTIVLGCTHYPLVKGLIQEIAGQQVTLIDTGPAVAQQVARKLSESNLCCKEGMTAQHYYLTNGDLVEAERIITSLLKLNLELQSFPK